MESHLFWLAAITQLLVSFRFVMLVRRRRSSKLPGNVPKLLSGQRKDSWAASAIIWGIILCKGLAQVDVPYAGGFVVLIWLTYRAIHRIHALDRPNAGNNL